MNEKLIEMRQHPEKEPSFKLKKDKKKKRQTTEENMPIRAEESHDPLHRIDKVKIADIAFAYENREIIGFLQQRGASIARKDYKKMREIDA